MAEPQSQPHSFVPSAESDGARTLSGRSPVVVEGLRELAREAPIRLQISGDCMRPHLDPDTWVEVRGARFYWPGDIVVVADNNCRLVAHRAIGWRPQWGAPLLVTMADAANTPDSPTPADQIVGRVLGNVGWRDRLTALWKFTVLLGRRLRRQGARWS